MWAGACLPTGLEIPIGMYILNPSVENVKHTDSFKPDTETSFSSVSFTRVTSPEDAPIRAPSVLIPPAKEQEIAKTKGAEAK